MIRGDSLIRLQQLRALALTVRHGKLTSVAQHMGVSQPTVTFHLAKLEREVGVPIFVSSARKVWDLTEFGKVLYQYAERMIALEDEIVEMAKATTSFQRGKIRMGSTHTPATYLLPAVLSKFRLHYPNIDLSLDVSPAHLLLPKVLKYDLDFCLINHFPASNNELEGQFVVQDEFVLISHPMHQVSPMDDLEPADFRELELIMHESTSMSRRMIDAWFQNHQIQPHILMDVSGTETMKEMVKQNLGVAIVSAMSCREEFATGTLVRHSLPHFTGQRAVYLVYRKKDKFNHASDVFLQMLRQLAREWQ